VDATAAAGGPEGTMRYQMKQKWLTLADDYVMRDEQGNERYHVQGKVFSFGDQLSLRDVQGSEVATISQKLFSWGPTYEIRRDGELAAVVKKGLFTFFHCRFTVDVPGPADLEAKGDFWDQEYTFLRGETPVAQVSHAFFSWTDTYGIDIADGEDDVLILAAAVVIDLCCHERSSSSD
jgi:uncharacterized protein YxjI